MEIRPILSAMLRSKTGAVLIAIQIAVTLAIVVNSIHLIHARLKHIDRETGMDVENIIAVRAVSLLEQYDAQSTIRADRERLLAIPGVIEAGATSEFPLSGSGSAGGFNANPEDEEGGTAANYYWVDEHAINALGVKLEEGRNFEANEVTWAKDRREASGFTKQVIITRAMADQLFEGGAALGQQIYDNLGRAAEVIGIIEHMHGAWVGWDNFDRILLQPKVADNPSQQYFVRTEPGQAERIVPLVEEVWSDDPNRMVSSVQTMAEMRASSYSNDLSLAKLLTVVIALLLAVTALGIVGLASFSVRQRTKQIGTRRAIGAQKFHILRYFLVENWLITTIGIVIGVGLSIGLSILLVDAFDMERLDLWYLPWGILGLWGLGLLAVLGPARKASSISPAIATRTV